jgi:hypothetical protein
MVETTNAVLLNLLLEKLKERYIMAYEQLIKSRKINNQIIVGKCVSYKF